MSVELTAHIDRWDAWNATRAPQYPNEKVIQYTLRNFPPATRGGVRALDLGCGSGINTWFLAREGFDVTGLDLSSRGLANARRLLDHDHLTATLVCAAGDALPLADDSFGYAICVRVLEILPPPRQQRLMAELARTLCPSGRAFALFASPLDYGVTHPERTAGYQFFAPDEAQVRAMFCPHFRQVDIDVYQTTFEGGSFAEHNFLVTAVK